MTPFSYPTPDAWIQAFYEMKATARTAADEGRPYDPAHDTEALFNFANRAHLAAFTRSLANVLRASVAGGGRTLVRPPRRTARTFRLFSLPHGWDMGAALASRRAAEKMAQTIRTAAVIGNPEMTAARMRYVNCAVMYEFNTALTMARQLAVGITHFRWRSMSGARPGHADMDGETYSWMGGIGSRYPGVGGCRCWAEGVYNETSLLRAGSLVTLEMQAALSSGVVSMPQ